MDFGAQTPKTPQRSPSSSRSTSTAPDWAPVDLQPGKNRCFKGAVIKKNDDFIGFYDTSFWA